MVAPSAFVYQAIRGPTAAHSLIAPPENISRQHFEYNIEVSSIEHDNTGIMVNVERAWAMENANLVSVTPDTTSDSFPTADLHRSLKYQAAGDVKNHREAVALFSSFVNEVRDGLGDPKLNSWKLLYADTLPLDEERVPATQRTVTVSL